MGAPLILVTASGLAREVMAAVEGESDVTIIGIVDDAINRQGAVVGGVRVIGPTEAVVDHPEASLVICAGRGVVRRMIRERLARLGVADDRFATVVAPGLRVPSSSRIGVGSILLGGTVVTADVTIGRHVVAMPNVTMTHDDRLDDYATVCAGVSLGGHVNVGREAYLGMNSSVRERCAVGDGSTLGMGAALLQDLPPGETWVGVPARSRRRVSTGSPFPRNFETTWSVQ